MKNSIQSKAMKAAWGIFNRKGVRTMEAWSMALKMGWIVAKSQARRAPEKEFVPMAYLKENRDWIIREILKYNSKNQLIGCMNAIKDAVLECNDENEADEKVRDIAMLQNFDIRDFWDENDRKLSERKRIVLG